MGFLRKKNSCTTDRPSHFQRCENASESKIITYVKFHSNKKINQIDRCNKMSRKTFPVIFHVINTEVDNDCVRNNGARRDDTSTLKILSDQSWDLYIHVL